MNKGEVFYSVYVDVVTDEKGDPVDGGYYQDYDTMEDAVDENLEGGISKEIFEMTPKSLGFFKREVRYVKAKKN